MRSMKNTTLLATALAALACAAVSAASHAASSTVVGFDGGDDGGFAGNAFFEADGGSPGGNAHFLIENFGIELRSGAVGEPFNPNFLGDYSSFGSITFSVDVQVNSLTFGGHQIAREIGVELIDRDIQGQDGASGVFFLLDYISRATHGDWTTLSVTITDPTQSGLPDGWIGFGDFDPVTFAPMLPEGATFASVLAGVDEFRLTSYQPGFVYGFTDFNVRVDNLSVSVAPVPAPGAFFLFASGLIAIVRRRR
jgi:hypothetical protein